MRILLLLSSILALSHAGACIWVSEISLDGKKVQVGDEARLFSREGLLTPESNDWEIRLPALRAAMAGKPSIRERSDTGGVLLHLGRSEEARDILLEAERLEPGDYAVAANLGTAYELLGQNQLALEWIGKGIERNRNSHHGTEWVHLKALEAKLALEKDANLLKTRSVSGIDFGSAPRPKFTPKPGIPAFQYPEALVVALGYQLRERMKFVKAPDPIVGDLLFDLGNTLAVRGAVETALGIYTLAQEYQAPRMELLNARVAYARQILARAGKASGRAK